MDDLEKLKKQIERLTKRQQELLYIKHVKKIKHKTVNKNGVFFDLSSVSSELLKSIIEFVKHTVVV